MNSKFESEYINKVDSMTPDMDKLWEKIAEGQSDDADITPFVSAAMECDKANGRKINATFRSFAAAAAVFGAVICAVMAFSDNDIISQSNGQAVKSNTAGFVQNSDSFEDVCEEAEPAEESLQQHSVIATMGWDYCSEYFSAESYEMLDLADTDSGIYTALSGNRDEEEYFVESKVLEDTEMFIDAKILYSDMSDDSCVKYTVQVIHLVADNDSEINDIVDIYSSSPYTLRNNREYLLPIEEKNGQFRVVFDNAPQIEFSGNREIICHNGWKSLTDNCSDIVYSQVFEDDYFFDRMNITAESSLENLFDCWERIHAD